MIKRIIYLFACCLVICSLAGCAGNGDDEADMPDVHSLADMLMQNVKFEDSVEEVSSETALRYYGIDSVQVQDSAVYMSTGATAEELAVFQASSTVDAQGILADMKKRRDSQLQMYLDYNRRRPPDLMMRFCMCMIHLWYTWCPMTAKRHRE